jgi:hypothetical protein
MAHLPIQASLQLLCLLLVLVFALYVAYQQLLSPLAKIPGRFGASLSRLWMVKHAWQGDMHRQMIDLQSKYGKLVRTRPNEISVSDLRAIKTIYGPIALPCVSCQPCSAQNSF